MLPYLQCTRKTSHSARKLRPLRLTERGIDVASGCFVVRATVAPVGKFLLLLELLLELRARGIELKVATGLLLGRRGGLGLRLARRSGFLGGGRRGRTLVTHVLVGRRLGLLVDLLVGG